ncbi:MAG TPA: energy transducer TonB [Candidatus Sulfotelmatobacter sp.]
MFAQFRSTTSQRQKILWSSLAAHGLLLAWLLHTPEPELLTPVSIAHGRGGNSLTRLYWPSKNPDDSKYSSPDRATQKYRRQRMGHEKLVLKQNTQVAKLTAPPVTFSPPSAEDQSKTATLSNQGHGAPAGLPYGTLIGGPRFGDEVRPALPVSTADPVAYPWELQDHEGNVVVEVTIDEKGDIVNKTVLESMGPKLDGKALAALESWRFHPATRNGAPISSKQDCIFHFRARG